MRTINPKVSVNTVILLLILVAVVVGGYLLVSTVRGLTRPLENAGSILVKQFEELTNPTPTIIPNPVTIIHEVRSLARLETS